VRTRGQRAVLPSSWIMVSYAARLGDSGGGTIPIEKVIGRAFVIVWPSDRATVLPIPATFAQPALNADS
jgi:hypothetical protein